MSSDKSEEDEHDVISKQIVDYYKKYSQNKHLPKYFSGTSLSYMPPIVKEDEIVTKSGPSVILDDTNSQTLVPRESVPSIHIEEPIEPKPVSPTSSITSNRKLEWDNGADIGYNNCNKNLKLQKSLSLPILLSSVDTKAVDKKDATKLCTEIVTVISYCCDGRGEVGQIESSSSSPSYPAELPIASSSSSIKTNPKPPSSSSSSLMNTLAYLKGKIGSPDAESTPKLLSKYTETPIIPKKNQEKPKNKIINLCLTKPILVQCLDSQKKKGFDKKIQTTFVENTSKCVQTTDSLEILTQPEKPASNLAENQSVILINYDSESDKRTCSSNTQTDGEIIASQCDSFEYYKDDYREVGKNGTLKRSSPKSDLAASTDFSKDLPILGELISTKQSKTVIGDVERSIELLQKLIKSKKYDEATKKRYIKKIVEKIVDTKYSEDSTTSSELFIPKKQQLQENVPWHPPQLSKFTVKTFSDEFLPSDEEKKSLLVDQSEENKSSLGTDCTGTSLEKQQNSSSGSYQSWKQDKTLSERLLEQKHRGQGDHLIKYASKERQHQIDWIKDEISHLTKLKGLLEKKVQRTTTVYMVSQHYDPKNPCGCICPQRNPPRNYVIQTELSSSSSDVPTKYNLYDKSGKSNYEVTESTSKTESVNREANVVGDIEVVSDDHTTNIKVKTKKIDTEGAEFKPKKPVLIGKGKYDTYPKSRAEERCMPCGMVRLLRTAQISGVDSHQLSLEVPLDSQSLLADKVTDFVNKINSNSSSDDHVCKCTDIINRKSKDLGLFPTSLTTQLPKVDLCRQCKCMELLNKKLKDSNSELPKPGLCHCCGRQNTKSQRGSTECQTDECNCCNKQVQASIPSKEASAQSASGKTESGQSKSSFDDKTESEPSKSVLPKIDLCRQCKCMELLNKKLKDPNSELPKPGLCHCCGRQNTTKLERGSSECQTDDCNCCNKQVQTSIPSKEASAQSASDKTESGRSKSSFDDKTGSEGSKSVSDRKAESERTKSVSDDKAESERSKSVSDDKTKSRRSKSESSESSTESSESSSSSSESVRSCMCCKRKNVTSKRLYALRQRLSDHAYPLCRPCYKQNRGAYSPNFFTNPGHICSCYTVVQTKTINEIKKTINDLSELERYCTCVNADKRSSSDYCTYCKCKLKKTSKNRNGIAYMLTFEDGSFQEDREKKKHKKKKHLEEIKIKIPVSQKKKHKDKENKRKKKKHSEREEAGSSRVSKKRPYNLQESLNHNRPDFVEVAESRRTTMNATRKQREESSDFNKLMFLKQCQEECERNAKRLFSSKEMKEITKRNYRKLPEVQKKLNDNKDKQLKQASRLMANTFNRKLRENVLKGKKDLPTDVKVVNF